MKEADMAEQDCFLLDLYWTEQIDGGWATGAVSKYHLNVVVDERERREGGSERAQDPLQSIAACCMLNRINTYWCIMHIPLVNL